MSGARAFGAGLGIRLASLKTSAVRKGDRYVVNGQKIWTSGAHYADWIFCWFEPASESPQRQEGSRSCSST